MNVKTVTLTQNREFKRLYAKGKSCPHPLLVTYARKNRFGVNRIGITTSKKIGKAVCRNRARRIIKAAYQQLEQEFPCGWDFVFVARFKTTLAKTQDIIPVMKKQVAKLTSNNKNGDGKK